MGREMLWLWDIFIPSSPFPPESVWSPDPALVNSKCFSTRPRSGGAVLRKQRLLSG